ncbi:MAG: ATP-binding protein [Clostridiales bacterium]|nr:ATP-binding protein [Clostridiales bacterium]
MGLYLDSAQPYNLYKSEVESPYFVDKTLLLRELFPLVKAGNKHVCITRPRRFGKSVMAAMIGAFFGQAMDSSHIFESLKIAKIPEGNDNKSIPTDTEETASTSVSPDVREPSSISTTINLAKYDYRDFMNHYHVIYINFLRAANDSASYQEFITTTKQILQEDLRTAFSDVRFRKTGTVIEDLQMIFEQTETQFILVLDEWDCIFHKDYSTDEDRRSFINWLAALTKDVAYLRLTYMTGVLPIYVLHRSLMQDAGLASHDSATLNGEAFPAKYSSGSTINNFQEYTMATDDIFSEYFGFTEAEVDDLYERYKAIRPNRNISREDLRLWYDGYHTPSSERMYNPRSVVEALTRNQIRSYWSATGSYNEIAIYIENNRADIRKDIALMVAGESVAANVEEYAATSMKLETRDELLSAMVVYGFLNYEEGKVRIANKELMDEFAKTIRERESLGYINRLAVESDRMLNATLSGDTKTMAQILQFAHDTEVPFLNYNNETELTAIVNLVFLSARDKYFVEREDKAGRGYVDFIFYPARAGDDGIILELKVGATPEKAIQQIKDKNYVMKFKGKMADRKQMTGQIRLVGIGYSKKRKNHRCKIEVLRANVL